MLRVPAPTLGLRETKQPDGFDFPFFLEAGLHCCATAALHPTKVLQMRSRLGRMRQVTLIRISTYQAYATSPHFGHLINVVDRAFLIHETTLFISASIMARRRLQPVHPA